MIPYYLLFLGLMSSSLLGVLGERKSEKLLTLFIAVLLIIVLSLRFGVGADYFSYERLFDQVNHWERMGFFIYDLRESTPIETGFALLILFVKNILESYWFFVMCLAFLSVLPKYFIFQKISPYLGLSFLVYFSDEWFWKDLSGARGSMAATLVLLSTVFAYKREPLKFGLTILVAVLFHTSSVLGIMIYFLRYISHKACMFSLLCLSFLCAVLFEDLAIEIAHLLGAIFSLEESSRLIKYIDSKYVDGIRVLGGTFMIHLTICLISIFYKDSLEKKWPINSIIIPMYVYGTVLMYLFIDYGIIAGRVREIISIPAQAVLLPSFLLLFRRNQRLIGYFVVLAYCSLLFYMMVKNRPPYQSILQFL